MVVNRDSDGAVLDAVTKSSKPVAPTLPGNI